MAVGPLTESVRMERTLNLRRQNKGRLRERRRHTMRFANNKRVKAKRDQAANVPKLPDGEKSG